MLKLFKYLKPYLFPVIIAVGLLYLQVNTDLSLPDYMSKIVNTGIQQGGIEYPIPSVIRNSELKNIEKNLDDINLRHLQQIYKNSDSEKTFIDINGKLSEDFIIQFSKAFILSKNMGQLIEGQDNNVIIQIGISLVRAEYEVLGIDMQLLQSTFILKTGGMMLLMTLISVLCAVSVGFIGSKTAAGGARKIRSEIFEKVESFSSAEFDTFSTASLITRSTNDVTQIQTVIFMIIRMVIYAPLLGVGGFIRAMGKAPSMGWLIGLAVVILLTIIISVMSIAMPKFKKVQELVDKLNLVARENLSGLLVVRAFNRQKFEENRFDSVNKDLTATNLFISRTMVTLMPVIMLIMNGLSIAIIWVGSKQVSLGYMQVGDMMAFIQYAMQIVMSFMMLSMVFIFLPRASVSGKRIIEVLETESSIKDKKTTTPLPDKIKGEIEFTDVTFKYPGGEVDALSTISFIAKPGTTTAFIGSTGSGKSTIVNLIPRFYDVTSGQITLDGIDIRDLDQKTLRSTIGFVPQKNVLFSGTIESNLKYGNKNATKNDLERIVKVSQAHEFIKQKDEGFNFPISQDGTNVSGGQRQRLAISRALMKDASIYVFDDSFSALDFKTDATLRRELKDSIGGKTVIIVAQRVATIMNAEQIIVLDDGKIVGQGTHKELLQTCKEYIEIANSQLGLQE
ncbi:MAG: ABC transporter ATP-binding protein [Spirochaetales bacterium]|nr:ABC transporter ATP-binding protein [Spirochaetales bacterium]